MLWIAPAEIDALSTSLENRVGDAADQFRAYCWLKLQGNYGSALGLLYLRFAERVRRRPHGYGLYHECVCP